MELSWQTLLEKTSHKQIKPFLSFYLLTYFYILHFVVSIPTSYVLSGLPLSRWNKALCRNILIIQYQSRNPSDFTTMEPDIFSTQFSLRKSVSKRKRRGACVCNVLFYGWTGLPGACTVPKVVAEASATIKYIFIRNICHNPSITRARKWCVDK